MNSTGQNGEKMRYRVILLLAVGLTAFSSAMKELNQVQQLTLDASRLIVQWSDKIAPTEIPQMTVKVETCESKQSTPSVELPWLANVAQEKTIETPPVVAERSRVSRVRLKRAPRVIDPVQFEVRIARDADAELDATIISELPLSLSKAKSRKHGIIRINPRDREILFRDREMLLKTLNRSINLRSAS